MKSTPNTPKTKKIKISAEIYDKIKKEASKLNQTVDQYAETLLKNRSKNGETESTDADSS